jgi:hypothetical protein
MPKSKRHWILTRDDIKLGIRHVCYEYISFLAGADEMLNPRHVEPVNRLIQDATLVHTRNLAEFFFFRPGDRLGLPPSPVDRSDLKALYYCDKPPKWTCNRFERESNLMNSLDKHLAHLSLAREINNPKFQVSGKWDGPTHIHGAVRLVMDTWNSFQTCVDSCYQDSFVCTLREAEKSAGGFSISTFLSSFDARVRSNPAYSVDTLP